MYGILLSHLGWCPQLLLGIVRQATKTDMQDCWSSLAASLEPFAHHWNVASLSLFYRYYFGTCSSKLIEMVSLTYSLGWSTCYPNRLHDFSFTIPRCYKSMPTVSFLTQLDYGILCLQNAFLWPMILVALILELTDIFYL